MPKRAAGSGKETKDRRKEKKGKLANMRPERRRRIYLTYRLPELLATIEKLAAETQTLSDRLNDEALAQGSPERRDSEQRLIYLREYRPVLMKELEALKKEHAKLAKEKD